MRKRVGLIAVIGTLALAGVTFAASFALKTPLKADATTTVVSSGYKTIWASSDGGNWPTSSSSTKLHYWSAVAGDGLSDTMVKADYSYTYDSTNNYVYYRFTVPVAVSKMQFVRFDSTGSTNWNNYTGDISSPSCGSIYYIWESSSWTFTTSTGSAKSNLPVDVFAAAIAGVQTCSSSTANGYPLYSNLNTNFYSKLVSGANLSTVSLNDHPYSQYTTAGGKYSDITGNPATSYTVQQKWDGIAAQYNAHQSSIVISDSPSQTISDTATVAGTVAGAAVLGFAGLILYRKKKLIA